MFESEFQIGNSGLDDTGTVYPEKIMLESKRQVLSKHVVEKCLDDEGSAVGDNEACLSI